MKNETFSFVYFVSDLRDIVCIVQRRSKQVDENTGPLEMAEKKNQKMSLTSKDFALLSQIYYHIQTYDSHSIGSAQWERSLSKAVVKHYWA